MMLSKCPPVIVGFKFRRRRSAPPTRSQLEILKVVGGKVILLSSRNLGGSNDASKSRFQIPRVTSLATPDIGLMIQHSLIDEVGELLPIG